VSALTFVAAGLIVAVIVAAWFYSRRGAREATATPGPETARALRHQALHGSRVELGLREPCEATKPWGVLMEMTYDEASVTVFALSDGNASIYLSTGGGFIGGIGQEPVRRAAIAMVQVAGTVASQMSPTDTFPLPDRGRTIFYLRTEAGVLTGTATERELAQRRHPLSPLFFAGQDVITQYRLVSEKK
jgi:hypothetical protein